MGVPRWTTLPAIVPLAAVAAVDPSGYAQALAPRSVVPTPSLVQLYLDERRLGQAAQALQLARSTVPSDPRVDDLADQLDAIHG